MYKKSLIVAFLLMAFVAKVNACEWYDPEDDYHNLFSQEIMNDPLYRPFLLIYGSPFYPYEEIPNGNIAEWQAFLGLGYDDTRYLVFNSSRDDLQLLIKGKTPNDSRLAFATPDFVKKNKQALLYLSYSKYLEPYMCITRGENSDDYWWIHDEFEHDAGELDYIKVYNVLLKSWKAESAVELKLRYGYQLVRLAHYTRRYDEAVYLFDQFVEPLGIRPEMYYYALSQKAGALRGRGDTEQANREFIRVFTNSTDLKISAYSSMHLGWDEISYNDFVKGAANDKERNDIYFLMGYDEFTNPCNEIEKIVANDPNAIQAKVLMVRAINSIERKFLSKYVYMDPERLPFLKQALGICDKQCNVASDKNFWNLASSYLHFLNKDYDLASSTLAKVKSDDQLYMKTVGNLTAYIDICRQPRLTADVERDLFARYADFITYDDFVHGVIAQKYEDQGDLAKAFLVLKNLSDIEYNPDEKFIDDIAAFLNKKKKTPMEEHYANVATIGIKDPNKYISYVKGVLRLTEGDLKSAKSCFAKQTRLTESKRIFGNNIRVWYYGDEDEIMRDDYISEFPFINDSLNEADVVNALIKLQEIGEKNKGDYSAKAYYLMSNFFYNTSLVGYFRHYLRFDQNNAFCSKFDLGSPYQNTLPLAMTYLEKAEKAATDPELKAHIAFAAAKNAQQDLELEGNWGIVYSEEHFDAFAKYKNTAYFDDVITNCVYFRYYHNGFY